MDVRRQQQQTVAARCSAAQRSQELTDAEAWIANAPLCPRHIALNTTVHLHCFLAVLRAAADSLALCQCECFSHAHWLVVPAARRCRRLLSLSLRAAVRVHLTAASVIIDAETAALFSFVSVLLLFRCVVRCSLPRCCSCVHGGAARRCVCVLWCVPMDCAALTDHWERSPRRSLTAVAVVFLSSSLLHSTRPTQHTHCNSTTRTHK